MVHLLRLLIGLAGGIAALALAVWAPFPLAWLVAIVVFCASGYAAERVFRSLADHEMVRADLADRTRNPPS